MPHDLIEPSELGRIRGDVLELEDLAQAARSRLEIVDERSKRVRSLLESRLLLNMTADHSENFDRMRVLASTISIKVQLFEQQLAAAKKQLESAEEAAVAQETAASLDDSQTKERASDAFRKARETIEHITSRCEILDRLLAEDLLTHSAVFEKLK